MPTLESTNSPATALYDQINQNVFLMPHFQRKFRWKTKVKKAFVDSLFRNVFCGAMLHIANNEALRFASRTVSIAVNDREEHYDGALTANHQQVLDGQQRICTFAEIFCNMHDQFGWYINIEKLGAPSWENNPEDYSWVIQTLCSGKDPYRGSKKVTEGDADDSGVLVRADLIFSDPRGLNKQVLKWFQKHAVRLYGPQFSDLPNEEAQDKAVEQAEEAAIRVHQRFEELRKYKFTIGHLDWNSPIEEILLNFVRINNQGLKLALYELAVPCYLKWINLYTTWDAALQKHPVLKLCLTKHGLGWPTLVACTMAINNGAALQKSTVFELEGATLAERWPAAIRAMAQAYTWGQEHVGCFHRESIPVHAPFVGLAAALMVEPSLFEKVDSLQLKRWFYAKLYRGAPPTYQEWRECFLSLIRPVQRGEPLKIPPMSVSLETILKLGSGYRGGADTKPRARARTIQCFAHAEGDIRDLKSGQRIREVVKNRKFSLNKFHIYPKSKEKALPFPVDSGVNIIISIKKTNDEVKADSPSEYLYTFLKFLERRVGKSSALGMFSDNPKSALDEMNERLASCFLLPPDGPFRSVDELQKYFAPQNMTQVMTNRARLIFDHLKNVMGPHLREEDDEELFEEGSVPVGDELDEEEDDEDDDGIFGLFSSE